MGRGGLGVAAGEVPIGLFAGGGKLGLVFELGTDIAGGGRGCCNRGCIGMGGCARDGVGVGIGFRTIKGEGVIAGGAGALWGKEVRRGDAAGAGEAKGPEEGDGGGLDEPGNGEGNPGV